MFFWIVSALIFVSVSPAQATDTIPDDMSIEIPFELPNDVTNIETNNTQVSKSLHTTLSYQAGLAIAHPRNLTSNHADVRIKGNTLFRESLYAQWDARGIIRGAGDDALRNDRSYDADYRLRELFVQHSNSTTTTKIGYQPIIWGELDAVSVLDWLTPRDYSEFAFTNPEDARISQPWIQIDAYGVGKWSFFYNPAPEVTHYPGTASVLLQSVFGDQVTVDIKTPQTFTDYEWGIRWHNTLDGSDINLVVADLLADDPQFLATSSTSFFGRYPRFQLIGASINRSAGSFLWKGEWAYRRNALDTTSTDTRNISDIGLGVEYDANGAYTLQLEAAQHHVLNHCNYFTQWAARWSKNFFNDTLSLIYFFSYQMPYRDRIHSAGVNYRVNDDLSLDFNVTRFDVSANDSPLRIADSWDQVIVKMGYSF